MATPLLSPSEARVLATLMEKARTVPDTYPLTLNALITGCNQKTCRDPVMTLDEAQVLSALDALRDAGLVTETDGGRTRRYAHQFQKGIGVPEQSAVLLGLLILRGPQTAGELRQNAERWYRFADISSVEAFLDELQERSEEKGGPLVVQLARAPGARESRWMHLLCGPVDEAALAASSASAASAGGGSALSERIEALEADVAALRQTVASLCESLGLEPPACHRTD